MPCTYPTPLFKVAYMNRGLNKASRLERGLIDLALTTSGSSLLVGDNGVGGIMFELNSDDSSGERGAGIEVAVMS